MTPGRESEPLRHRRYPRALPIAAGVALIWLGTVPAPGPRAAQARSEARPTSQQPSGARPTQQPSELMGTVVLAPDSVPLSGVEVSLHVITPDSGAVLATKTSDETGRFRFVVNPDEAGEPESTVYLLTARYQGVLYVGDARHSFQESAPELSIVVYESRPIEEPPLARRWTLVQRAGGAFEFLDVFELENGSDSSLVPVRDSDSFWEIALPEGAGRTASASIGFGGGSYELRGDRMLFDLSVPPGGRTFSVRYRLNGPVVRLVADRPLAEQLVLVEEGAGIRVEGLGPAAVSEVEGRPFARFSGAERQVGDAATLRMTTGGSPNRYAWVALAVGVLFAAAAVAAWRLAGRSSAA